MNKEYEILAKAYEESAKETENLRRKLIETPDGFLYFVTTRVYNYVKAYLVYNKFQAKEILSNYSGDNGSAHCYHDNPNFEYCREGGFAKFLSSEIMQHKFTKQLHIEANEELRRQERRKSRQQNQQQS